MSSSSESDNDPIICFKEQTQYPAFDYREKLSLNADEIRHTRELFEMIEEKSLFIMSNIAFLVDSKWQQTTAVITVCPAIRSFFFPTVAIVIPLVIFVSKFIWQHYQFNNY